MTKDLANISHLRHALAKSTTFGELAVVAKLAISVRDAMSRAGLALGMVNEAAEVWIDALYLCGEKMRGRKAGPGRGNKKQSPDEALLSSRSRGYAQQLCRQLPEGQDSIVTYVAEATEAGTQATASGCLSYYRIASPATPVLDGIFRVVYADPPWDYGNRGMIEYGPADRHYPSMTIEELCAIDVVSHIADDSVLFLWVTSPLLDECWPVIEAWGFTYKTSFVWDKVKHNHGHYNSVRHEFLLICTRGSYTPEINTLFDSVVEIERSDTHSEKPSEFRDMIDTLYPSGNRLELFARADAKGWTRWGS